MKKNMGLLFICLLALLAGSEAALSEDGPEYLQRTVDYFYQKYGDKISHRYKRPISIFVADHESPGADFLDNFKTSVVEIRIFRPMLKIEGFHEEHLAFALCHEVGHGLAGGRKMPFPQRGMISDKAYEILKLRPRSFVEGEADYYSVRCFKQFLRDNEVIEKRITSQLKVDADVVHACKTRSKRVLCETILQVAKATHVFLQGPEAVWIDSSDEDSYFYRDTEPRLASYSNRDPMKLIFFTEHEHPNLQCRLDTFKASLFNKGRPRCWFSPFFGAYGGH